MSPAIATFAISTVIMGIGIYRAHNMSKTLLYALIAVGFLVNALDVFIEGNQTQIRQIAYLVEGIAINLFASRRV